MARSQLDAAQGGRGVTYRSTLLHDADRAACNAAPGPWKVVGTTVVDVTGRPVAQAESYADALAIVAAFNLVGEVTRDQALKDELERGADALRKEIAELNSTLEEREQELEDMDADLTAKREQLAGVASHTSGQART